MPDLPSKYSEWELLQAAVMRIQNKEVQQYFKDAPDNDLNSTRSTLKFICTIKDRDSAPIVLVRMFFFWIVTSRLHAIAPEIYGIPVPEYHESVKFFPQVRLHFKQKYPEPNKRALTAEISFRIMAKASSITQSEVERLARDIRREFGGATPHQWHKGKKLVSYYDEANGYRLKVLGQNENDAREVITKIMKINGDDPVWGKAGLNEALDEAAKYPTSTSTVNILNKLYKLPQRRRKDVVEITHAELTMWPASPVLLYDRQNKRVGAVLYEQD